MTLDTYLAGFYNSPGSGTSAVSGTELCDGEDPDRNVAGYKNLGTATDLADCTSKC